MLLAGAGIPGGTLYGTTDAHAAFPVGDRVSPAQLVATILHALGVPPEAELTTAACAQHMRLSKIKK